MDVVPAPGRPSLPPQMYSSPYSRTPGIDRQLNTLFVFNVFVHCDGDEHVSMLYLPSGDDDASSIGGYSSHSTSSPMSAGGERLKDRLRRVQETFAQLRHSAV